MKCQRRLLNNTRKLPQKSKPTITTAHRYHPFTDKATGERCPVTQEEAGQIVSLVIHQELRG